MKKLLIILFAFTGMQLMGQSPEIPANVIKAFNEKYPDAEDITWVLRKDTYQAEFFDFFQTLAVYGKDGVWLKTISMISDEDMPENMYEYLDDNYNLEDISQIHMIETNKNVITYKIIILEESGKVILEFSEEGSLLKTSV